MVYMKQHHLHQVSSRYLYVMACKILLMLFCIRASYVLRSDYLMLILKFYTIPVHLHVVTSFLNHKTISSKHMSFLPHKYYVISQLSHSYAKGPFCETQLIHYPVLFSHKVKPILFVNTSF